MKIGLFADPHYSTETLVLNRRPSLSYEKVNEVMTNFSNQNVDMVICLGDLINAEHEREQNVTNLTKISSLIKSFNLPFHCLFGNHDAQAFDAIDFEQISGFKMSPYSVDTNDIRFIFLNANYTDDENPYSVGKNPWKNSYIPQAELTWLEKTLSSAKRACVCSHQNLDERDNPHVIRNAAKVRELIEKSNNVSYVFSGHYHKGYETKINDINYFTPKALCIEEEINYNIIEI